MARHARVRPRGGLKAGRAEGAGVELAEGAGDDLRHPPPDVQRDPRCPRVRYSKTPHWRGGTLGDASQGGFSEVRGAKRRRQPKGRQLRQTPTARLGQLLAQLVVASDQSLERRREWLRPAGQWPAG